ncbi:cytochrome c oxidase assembly protein COX16 [bacterium]|nr:cytochrome c oxidase assembly protein COX16 [bacterium]
MTALTLLSLVLGAFGLAAFTQVRALRRQVYLLRLDVRDAGLNRAATDDPDSSCGCGCGCG